VIDRMTLASAGEIFAYWERNPPAHLMLQAIAGMFGWAPRRAAGGGRPLDEIAAAPPPGLVVLRGAAAAMPAPLDADALRARNRALANQRAAMAAALPADEVVA
jgi:hypothetical protein